MLPFLMTTPPIKFARYQLRKNWNLQFFFYPTKKEWKVLNQGIHTQNKFFFILNFLQYIYSNILIKKYKKKNYILIFPRKRNKKFE